MRARRGALSDAERATAAAAVSARVQAMAAWRAPLLLAYVDADGELGTAPLLAAAHAAGTRVYLPCVAGGAMWFAEHPPGGALRRGAFGLAEPGGAPLAAADLGAALALVPLLAWDSCGGRVGRGGGHYDRTLTGAHRPRWLVGLGYAFQQVPAVPHDPWDLRLDAVVTPEAVVTCWPGDAPSPPREEVVETHGSAIVDRRQPGAGGRPGLRPGCRPAPTG